MSAKARRRLRVAAWIGLLAALGLLLAALPVTDWIESLRGAFETLGIGGMVLYALGYGLASTLLVPAAPLQIGAGLLFGLGPGIAVGLAGGWLAIGLAFIAGRHLARDRVQSLLDGRPWTRAIEEVISEGDWKTVALLRLSPLLPFSLHNHVYGLTRIPFWRYWPAACLAVAPGTVMWAYTGYLGAAASASLGEGDASIGKWALRAVGLAATIAVTVLLARRAKAKLDDTDAMQAAAEESDDDAPSAAQVWAWVAAAVVLLAGGVLGQVFSERLADWLS